MPNMTGSSSTEDNSSNTMESQSGGQISSSLTFSGLFGPALEQAVDPETVQFPDGLAKEKIAELKKNLAQMEKIHEHSDDEIRLAVRMLNELKVLHKMAKEERKCEDYSTDSAAKIVSASTESTDKSESFEPPWAASTESTEKSESSEPPWEDVETPRLSRHSWSDPPATY